MIPFCAVGAKTEDAVFSGDGDGVRVAQEARVAAENPANKNEMKRKIGSIEPPHVTATV
jgi:hypothetical protein